MKHTIIITSTNSPIASTQQCFSKLLYRQQWISIPQNPELSLEERTCQCMAMSVSLVEFMSWLQDQFIFKRLFLLSHSLFPHQNLTSLFLPAFWGKSHPDNVYREYCKTRCVTLNWKALTSIKGQFPLLQLNKKITTTPALFLLSTTCCCSLHCFLSLLQSQLSGADWCLGHAIKVRKRIFFKVTVSRLTNMLTLGIRPWHIQSKIMNPAHCIQPAEEQFKMYLNLPTDIKAFSTAVFDLM